MIPLDVARVVRDIDEYRMEMSQAVESSYQGAVLQYQYFCNPQYLASMVEGEGDQLNPHTSLWTLGSLVTTAVRISQLQKVNAQAE